MQDIQRSYRRLAVKLHPDKHGDDEELSKQVHTHSTPLCH